MEKASKKGGGPLAPARRRLAALGRGQRAVYSAVLLLLFALLTWTALAQEPDLHAGASFWQPIIFPRKHLRPAVEADLHAVAYDSLAGRWLVSGDGGLLLQAEGKSHRWQRRALSIEDPQALRDSLNRVLESSESAGRRQVGASGLQQSAPFSREAE